MKLILGFTTEPEKLRHEMIHTGARPVTCQICNNSFRSKSDLKDHTLRQHTNIRPFICDICQRDFADRGAYRAHLIGHEKQLGIVLDKSIKKFLNK